MLTVLLFWKILLGLKMRADIVCLKYCVKPIGF